MGVNMKLKYYMRGLGIGVAVTAFTMGILYGKADKGISDEAVLARARELGMVESTVLSSIQDNLPEGDPKENQADTPATKETPESQPDTLATKETESQSDTPATKETPESQPDTPATKETPESQPDTPATKEATKTQPDTPEAKDNPEKQPDEEGLDGGGNSVGDGVGANGTGQEMAVISIKKGESSVSVSKSLAAAGLVDDAAAYDKYLCSNGYDKSLSVGSYKIPLDATEEEIAKVITRKLSFE